MVEPHRKEFIGEVVFQLAMRVAAFLGLSLFLELWRHEREMSSNGTKPGLLLECQRMSKRSLTGKTT